MPNKITPIKSDVLQGLQVPENLEDFELFQIVIDESSQLIEVPAGALYYSVEAVIVSGEISIQSQANLKAAFVCRDAIVCDSIHLRKNSYVFADGGIILSDNLTIDDKNCELISPKNISIQRIILNAQTLPESLEKQKNIFIREVKNPDGFAKDYLKSRQKEFEKKSLGTIMFKKVIMSDRPGEGDWQGFKYALIFERNGETIFEADFQNYFSPHKNWIRENLVELKYQVSYRFKQKENRVILDLKNETAMFNNEPDWIKWSDLLDSDNKNIRF